MRYTSILLFILLRLLCIGQISHYTFTQSSIVYQSLASDTINNVILGNKNNIGNINFFDASNLSGNYDEHGKGMEIGFDFTYNGQKYDRFGVMNNGVIVLGKQIFYDYAIDLLPSTSSNGFGPQDSSINRIAVMSTELAGNGYNSQLFYQRTGQYPNRQLIVEWNNYKFKNGFTSNASLVNCQIILSEGSNRVEFAYGPCRPDPNSIDTIYAMIGLFGYLHNDFNTRLNDTFFSFYNTVPGLTFDALSKFVANHEIVNTAGDMVSLKWQPPSCNAPLAMISDLHTNSLKLHFTKPQGQENLPYQYSIDTTLNSTTQWYNITNTDTVFSNLLAAQFYNIKMRCRCNGVYSGLTSINVVTPVSSVSLPFFENFNTQLYDETPSGFTIFNKPNASSPWRVYNSNFPYNSNYLGVGLGSNYSNQTSWIFTPPLITTKDSLYYISFDYVGNIEILTGHTPLTDSMSAIGIYSNQAYSTKHESLFFKNRENRPMFIGFKSVSATTSLDNLDIQQATCDSLHDIIFTILDPTVVKIDFDAAPINSFEYSLQEGDDVPELYSVIDTNNVIFSNLIPDHNYKLYLRHACSSNQHSIFQIVSFTTPVANDSCINAIEIMPNNSNNCLAGSTRNASPSYYPISCNGASDDDVWYKFTATKRSHKINLNSGGSNRTVNNTTIDDTLSMEIYKGNCSTMQLIGCMSNSGNISFVKTDFFVDSTYYIRVYSKGIGTFVNFGICVSSFDNKDADDCQHASTLNVNGQMCDFVDNFNFAACIPSSLAQSTCNNIQKYSIWTKFAATDTAHIINANFLLGGNGALEIFKGTCNALSDMICVDNTSTGAEIVRLSNLIIGDTIIVHIVDKDTLGLNVPIELCISVPYENDLCANALEITSLNGPSFQTYVTGNTSGAMGNGGCSSSHADDDLWYKFKAIDTSHIISVFSLGIEDPFIELFEGDCTSASLGCEAHELVAHNLLVGNTYYFRVFSKALLGGQGAFRLSINVPPRNLICTMPRTILLSNNGACKGNVLGSNEGSGLKNKVWYTFKSTQTSHTFLLEEISGSGFAMQLYNDCLEPLSTQIHGLSNANIVQYDSLIIGHNYLLAISSPTLEGVFFQGQFEICIGQPPVNDERNFAIEILPNATCVAPLYGTVIGATTDTINKSDCNIVYDQYDVWYKFVATSFAHQVLAVPLKAISVNLSLYVTDSLMPLDCSQKQGYNQNDLINRGDFIIGDTYYIKVNCRLPYENVTWDSLFSICILNRPDNDLCQYATYIDNPLTHSCVNSTYGTTINATSNDGGKGNVFYRFIYTTGHVGIKVKSHTQGFDPMIKLWSNKLEGVPGATLGVGDDGCLQSLLEISDYTHNDNVPEVLIAQKVTQKSMFPVDILLPPHVFMFANREYIIEVTESDLSKNAGDFEICLFNPNNSTDLHYVTQETYNMDTSYSHFYDPIFHTFLGQGLVQGSSNAKQYLLNSKPMYAPAGKYHQAVCQLNFGITGSTTKINLSKFEFDLSSTTSLEDIAAVSLYIVPDGPSLNYRSLDLENFNTHYKGSEFPIIPKPMPIKFGVSIKNPTSNKVSFEDSYNITGKPHNLLEDRHAYLVYDLKCNANQDHFINAVCNFIVVDGEEINPLTTFNNNIPITTLEKYETTNDGLWSDSATWVCNAPPPTDPSTLVQINHHIELYDTAQVGDLKLMGKTSLRMQKQSMLTLGRSSEGANQGFSNKYFDASEGSLIMDGSILNVNGRLQLGSTISVTPNGICCNEGEGHYTLTDAKGNVMASGGSFGESETKSFCINARDTVPDDTFASIINSPTKTLFYPTKMRSEKHVENLQFAKQKVAYDIDESLLNAIYSKKTKKLLLNIPGPHEEYLLNLERVDNFGVEIVTTASGKSSENINRGLHYRGKIQGDEKSIVSITFFERSVSGFISNKNGNINISNIEGTNSYYIFNENELNQKLIFNCQSNEEITGPLGNVITRKAITNRTPSKCIDLYIEVNYDIFLNKGSSVENTYNFISSLYNQVFAIYAAEGITMHISEIKIWDIPSPYIANDPKSLLGQFADTRVTYNGNLAQLIGFKGNGGYASIDGLCQPKKRNSMSYVGIDNTYATLPIYSWSVNVCAHEIGHLLGSQHTHACVWNGNNTAIDGCYETEGNCPAPPIPAIGGTIMSYCHLNQSGVNLSLGFGIQPGDLIRFNIDNNQCLEECNPISCALEPLIVTIVCDDQPQQTTWKLYNNNGTIVANGGPYNIPNKVVIEKLCLPVGCYQFIIEDKAVPPLKFEFRNSILTIDPSDGDSLTSVPQPFFDKKPILSIGKNSYPLFINTKIQILDPLPNISLLYPIRDESSFHDCDIIFGGGDDASSSEIFIVAQSYNNYDTRKGLMQFDTISILSTTPSLARKLESAYSPLGGKSMIVAKDIFVSEYSTLSNNIGILRGLHNEGLIVIDSNEYMVFGNNINLYQATPNLIYDQYIKGNGRFLSSKTMPIPINKSENSVGNLFSSSFNGHGLALYTPISVKNDLRLDYGHISTSDTSLLTIESEAIDSIAQLNKGLKTLVGTEYESQLNYFQGGLSSGSINTWQGGYIDGPLRRKYKMAHGGSNGLLFPVGDGPHKHSVSLTSNHTNVNYITVQFKKENPLNIGLPILNEQNTSINSVSPSGYWQFRFSDTTMDYSIHIDAHNFEKRPAVAINDINNVRLIKRPIEGTWQHSFASTTTGPTSLSNVTIEHISKNGDLGLGNAYCYMVTNESDAGAGSLRAVLDCIEDGDSIAFAATLDTIHIYSDTLTINKNIKIKNENASNIIINQESNLNLISIKSGHTVSLENLILRTNGNSSGRAILNNAILRLKDIELKDSGSINEAPFVNKGELIIEGNNKIKRE